MRSRDAPVEQAHGGSPQNAAVTPFDQQCELSAPIQISLKLADSSWSPAFRQWLAVPLVRNHTALLEQW